MGWEYVRLNGRSIAMLNYGLHQIGDRVYHWRKQPNKIIQYRLTYIDNCLTSVPVGEFKIKTNASS